MFSERLQLLVSGEQRRRLEFEAKRRGRSVSSLIRESVDAHLGSINVEDRQRALAGIRQMHGSPISPQELDRIVEQEREQHFPAVPRATRR